MSHLLALPQELIAHIVTHADSAAAISLSKTCRYFHTVVPAFIASDSIRLSGVGPIFRDFDVDRIARAAEVRFLELGCSLKRTRFCLRTSLAPYNNLTSLDLEGMGDVCVTEIPWSSWQNLEELRLTACLHEIYLNHECHHAEGAWRTQQRVVVQEEISELYDPLEESLRDGWTKLPLDGWDMALDRTLERRILQRQITELRSSPLRLPSLRRLKTHPCLLERIISRSPGLTHLEVSEKGGCHAFYPNLLSSSYFSSVTHATFSRMTFWHLMRIAPHFLNPLHLKVNDVERRTQEDLVQMLVAFHSAVTVFLDATSEVSTHSVPDLAPLTAALVRFKYRNPIRTYIWTNESRKMTVTDGAEIVR